MEHEKIYLLTDGCMWELNKKMGEEHPHAMEVVDIETGAIRYIKSGSKIAFIEGDISDLRTQKAYNKATEKKTNSVPSDRQIVSSGKGGKKSRKRNEQTGV